MTWEKRAAEAAYMRHMKAHEVPCNPCRGAHNEARRRRYLEAKERAS